MSNQIVINIRNAMQNDEMYLVYQPICDEEQYIIGYEVLMRWDSKSLGSVKPLAMIASFEENTLINELNDWFFNRLIKDIEEVGLLRVKKLFINLSFKQLEDGSLDSNISNLEEVVDFSKVVFEITESTVTSDINKVLKTMTELTNKGVSFALDDFGVGFSSLKHLKLLPLHFIKIDREFVGEIDVSHADMAIVKAALDMSKALGFKVIAQGVENQSQFVLLRSMGMSYFQGYLFNKPCLKSELS